MKQEKIQAYLLRVNKLSGVVYKGYLAEVDNTLEAEQRYVNYDEPHGLITVLSITDEIDVIANDEGKLMNYPINRFVVDDMGGVYDMLVGSVDFIAQRSDEQWSDEQKVNLLDSIFCGIVLPDMVIVQCEGKDKVIDGKQRLTTLIAI